MPYYTGITADFLSSQTMHSGYMWISFVILQLAVRHTFCKWLFLHSNQLLTHGALLRPSAARCVNFFQRVRTPVKPLCTKLLIHEMTRSHSERLATERPQNQKYPTELT